MSGKVHIGVAGWSYDDWKGIVYPKGVDQLVYLSEFVDCIEINSTFYRPPSVKNSASWLKRTAEREGFGPLIEAGRLKELLAQFRYDFDDTETHRDIIEKIVDEFGDVFRLVVEVRHKSWQDASALEFLEGAGVSVCHLDYPVSSNSFDMEVCKVGRVGYFRMHGRNYETWFSKAGRDETYNYHYSADELGGIKRRLDEMSRVFESVTVIANNHYRGAEVANALELKEMFTGRKQRVPEGLLKEYPELKRISRSG